MKLEPMAAFFDSRLDGYDTHMLTNIAGAAEFYPFTAQQLPAFPGAQVLDLGCGTGLELDTYFECNPTAQITGIDLAEGMLGELKRKYPDKALDLSCGSYFDVPFGEESFDAAVSVESLHHFTMEEKNPLYRKLWEALRDGGSFILTDYFSLSEAEEQTRRKELLRLKAEQGLPESEFYHYDIPLTVAHEVELLKMAGFSTVTVLKNWGATHCLRAEK